MSIKKTAVVLTCLLVFGSAPAPAQDVPAARALLRQALEALTPPPPPPTIVVLGTPADLDAAIAAAAPGAVLTLSRTLVYPTALTLSKPVTLQAEALAVPPARMDTATPLPSFRDGITIPGDGVTLIGVEVKKANPLTDILTFTGANVTLDRLRILGDPVKGAKRGIAANGNGNAHVTRSYVEDCFQSFPGNDSQALITWDMAPGLSLVDNYFSGGSESIMIGGADASSPERMPSQIIIRGNTITKRPEWQALPIGVKNTLEIKAGRNILIDGNDISESWGGHGQDGYGFLATVRNQDGRAPWSTIQDVDVVNNHFSHMAGAINLLGIDNIKETKANMPTPVGTVRPSVTMARVTIRGNTFTDVDPTLYTGSNRLILLGGAPVDVTIDQNTFAGAHLGAQVYFYGGLPAAILQRLVVTSNTWPKSTYAIKGDGTASGAATWAAYVTGGTLAGNVEK